MKSTNTPVVFIRARLFKPALLLVGFVCASTSTVMSQAPSLLWSTNIGATLFAVDNQTNSYANAGGSVIIINPSGVPISTNVICPRPGLALRDSSGNYYFAGVMPGHTYNGTDTSFDPQDFGGIVLSNKSIFLAKYSAAGSLLWATNFGPASVKNSSLFLFDFITDGQGNPVVSYRYGISSTIIRRDTAKHSSAGTPAWLTTTPIPIGLNYHRLAKYGPTNFYSMFISSTAGLTLNVLNGAGTETALTNWSSTLDFSVETPPPVVNSQGDFYNVEGINPYNLVKRSSNGALIWTTSVSGQSRCVGPDEFNGVHVAGNVTNNLLRYDFGGNLIWTLPLPARCLNLILDANNNSFVALSGGIVGRVTDNFTPQPASILVAPQTQIVQLGANVTFPVTATGTPNLYYQWRKDGTNLNGAISTNYTINGVTTNHIGSYAVVVTNVYGSVTSTPPAALLISPSLVSPFNGTIGIWGQQATLSVSAFGSGTLSYQWYNAGQLITGATNNTLMFPTLQLTNAGLYSVVVSSQYGSVSNTPAALVVNPANVSIGIFAGVIIEGTVGYSYGIEYATNLQNAVWQSLTNITLTQPTEIWVDTGVQVPGIPKRFYRVTAQ